MRIVASFASLLLLLAVASDFAKWTKEVEVERTEAAQNFAPHTFRLFSSGWHLRPPKLGERNRFQGAFVDDKWYYVDTKRNGMRVVTVPPDGSEISIESYDLGASDVDVNRFETMLANTPVNTVLAMSSFRFLAPRVGTEPKRRQRIGYLLRGIGAKSAPEETPVSCFAFLCIRRPQGFVPLAERYSKTHGVSLSFHLDADLPSYDDHTFRTIIDNRLTVRFEPDQATGDNLVVESRRFLEEVGFPAIRTRSMMGKPARVTWTVAPDADLGDLTAATFSARVALHWNDSDTLSAVRIGLRINGIESGSRAIFRDAGEAMRWLAWEELLVPGLEKIETVEIEVERFGKKGPAAVVYIADALLRSGRVTSL